MQNGSVAVPKRTEHGGESIVFWANSSTQAALRRQAEQRGVSPAVAARQIVQEWLAEHDPDYKATEREG